MKKAIMGAMQKGAMKAKSSSVYSGDGKSDTEIPAVTVKAKRKKQPALNPDRRRPNESKEAYARRMRKKKMTKAVDDYKEEKGPGAAKKFKKVRGGADAKVIKSMGQ